MKRDIIRKDSFIYWKKKKEISYTKSWVKDVIDTDKGIMITIEYGLGESNYLIKDIDFLIHK